MIRSPLPGQRHDRTIDEAQTEIREAPVHLHRTRELADCRRRVGEGAANEVLHEHLHRLALVAKEAVNFGKDETGDIAGTRLVDGGTKEPVVWRASVALLCRVDTLTNSGMSRIDAVTVEAERMPHRYQKPTHMCAEGKPPGPKGTAPRCPPGVPTGRSE